MEQTGRRRFDDYEIDLGTGELRRHGQPVALQRHPARVLARLVGRAGTLVPREELHAAVWNDDVHVDFDRGLNYCVRQLRQTLGDDAKTPRFIETVARQGYRFVAVVEPVAYPPLTNGSETGGRQNAAPRLARRWRIAAVTVAVVLLGFAADRLVGGHPEHHDVAVAVARTLHDIVF